MNRLTLIPMLLALLASSAPAASDDALLLCGFEEVFAVSPRALAAGKVEKLWSWKAEGREGLPEAVARRFGTTDDCKPVRDGRQVLITSSGGGCALVDYPSGAVKWSAVVENAHSIELLPGDRVVVAGSTGANGNRLVLFDLARPDAPIWHAPLHSAHGVVWDEPRRALWAIGYDELRRYSLADWDSDRPSLKLERTHPLPDDGGHDLQAVPGSNDLAVTTHATVSLFDRETGEFRPHPALGGRKHVKALAIHPTTGETYFVQADSPEWWSRSLRSLDPPRTIPVEGERLYKARWLIDEKR
ncbi:DUF6528 family protein [Paludisphaera sp.]|uniref:DUF6528 family protein n=1 Tax=Paludisphaera sp. TaxID=2017432 RepID=UPI00301CF84D